MKHEIPFLRFCSHDWDRETAESRIFRERPDGPFYERPSGSSRILFQKRFETSPRKEVDSIRFLRLLICASILVIMALPIYVLFVPLDGDYSETESIQYVSVVEVTVEVPADNGWPKLPWLYTPMLERYVMPDDPAVRQVADALREYADAWGFSERRLAERAKDWVYRNIRYVSDSEAHGLPDCWQTPYQTLRLGTGDCEDLAVLYVSICEALGFETVLVSEPGHLSAGVLLDADEWDCTVSFGGKEYLTAEATTSAHLGDSKPDVIMVYPTHAGLAVCLIVLVDLLVIGLTLFVFRRIA